MEEAKKEYVLRHVLVPKHEVLSKEESEELLKKYSLLPAQLPFIKNTDPAAAAVGANLGDIVKITRDSPTAGKAVTYRYVVEE
ncbi:MAG: DNA-directed RNA polymerase subunit H [Candidatus Hadarchaeota archaeon]